MRGPDGDRRFATETPVSRHISSVSKVIGTRTEVVTSDVMALIFEASKSIASTSALVVKSAMPIPDALPLLSGVRRSAARYR